MRRRTEREVAWLVEKVPSTTIGMCREMFEREFGWLPTETAWHTWNNRRGLSHAKVGRPLNRRVERPVSWKKEPEMLAWMLENDRGRDTKAISDEFRERFGFGLTQTQITLFRQSYGNVTRDGNRHCRVERERPIGAETRSKNGYIKVKVAEFAEKPGTKDNWKLKHRLVWEMENGESVPDGYDIMFADGDICNFDPGNLVAVPHAFQAMLKGKDYWDAESLKAAVALCRLESGIIDAECMTKVCKACGKTFVVSEERRRKYGSRVSCCQECVESGAYRSWKTRTPKGERICAVCGSKFTAYTKAQVRCASCIAKAPKHSAAAQRRCGGSRKDVG